MSENRQKYGRLLRHVLCWLACCAAVSVAYGSGVSLSVLPSDDSLSVSSVSTDTVVVDSLATVVGDMPVKKRPWLAAAEVAGLNVGLLAFDRFVLNGAYAHVTLNTIRRNLRMTNWYWDSDRMYTNLLEHPYHGMLYYNASRSNGMGFGVSALYTLGGSLMWELVGEMELPSVNDFLATSLGGIAIGEVSYRLSDLVLDGRSTGTSRVFRELGGALLNPMRGLNRLLTGESWRRHVCRSTFIPRSWEADVVLGFRTLQVSGEARSRLYGGFLDIGIRYGDLVVEESTSRPFDRFVLSMGLSMAGGQQLLNRFSIRGRLCAKQLSWGRFESELGIYQHFSYYFTDKVHGGEVPYKFSEAGCVGGGFVFGIGEEHRFRVENELYANGILLGGMMSDYSGNLIDRDYNIGSGFSVKSFTNLYAEKWLRAGVGLAYYRLFTWLDFSDIDTSRSPVDWSTQGDGGVAGLWVVSPRLDIRLRKDFGIRFSGDYLSRHTHYDHLPYRHSHTWEFRLGLRYYVR